MSTSEERAEWAKLADAATEGPWEAHGTAVLACTGPGSCQGCSGLLSPAHEPSCYWSEIAGAGGPDAEFVAASRTAVPALLDALDAAEAELVALRAQIERVRELHRRVLDPGTPIYCCDECGVPVESEPCATIRALDGEGER